MKTPHLKPRHGLWMAMPLVLLTGCASLQPEAMSAAEMAALVAKDKAALAQGVEALKGPLTLHEAIARAIRYNADRRVKELEEALAKGAAEVSSYDMLPKLVASAGYRDRNNDLVTRSTDSVTGAPSLANPAITSSRHATTSGLEFSWSLLDFGQSYYAARQSADRALIAAERRRKAMHNLIQDVRSVYWRAVAAQKLSDEVRVAIADAELALMDARKAENEKIRSPLDPLRYQRQLLENLRLLETIEQELSTARVELTALANLPIGSQVQVVEPAAELVDHWMKVPVNQLEQHALAQNPDLRESMYGGRIAQEETRRTMLKLFPGLSFSYANHHSSDNYLVHQSWNDASAQVSFNLLGLISAPAQMRMAEAGVAAADQRRMATQIAVLTQLHVARIQYANTLRAYQRANTISQVEGRITEHVNHQEQAQKTSKLERVTQQTSHILSQMRRYQALSNAQAAASRLHATLGMDLPAPAPEKLNLVELTGMLHGTMSYWDRGRLPRTLPPQSAIPVSATPAAAK